MASESQTTVNSSSVALGQNKPWAMPRWAKIALTIGVLLLLSWQVRWSEVLAVVTGASAIGLFAAVLLWFPNQGLQYLRWSFIARRASVRPEGRDVHASYWLGHTLGFITPGRVGAYGRGLFLHNVPVGEATALTVLERSYSAITVNGFGMIALAILPQLGWQVEWASWGTGVSVALLGLGSMLLLTGVFPSQIARLLSSFTASKSWGRGISKSLNAISGIPYGSSLLNLSLASGSLVVSLVQFVLVLGALGIDVPLLAGLLAVHLNFFLKGNIPLTLGNLGVGEWTALLCLRGLGVPDTQAVAASLILFSLNVAIPALIGARYIRRLFTIHHDWKQRVK